jgi:hypothetical protein
MAKNLKISSFVKTILQSKTLLFSGLVYFKLSFAWQHLIYLYQVLGNSIKT